MLLLDYSETAPSIMTSPNFFYASSPTVVLPPQYPPDQYFANSHYSNGTSFQGQQPTPNGSINPFTPSVSGSIPPTPGSLAGRKRSRGDIHAPEDDDMMPDGSLPTPDSDAPSSRGNAVMGPDMTFIYPGDPDYSMAAESQSGTWVEATAERKPFQLNHAKRPSVASRKSQRLDSTAGASDDLAQLVLPPNMRQCTVEPLIDEAIRTLGISWIRMDRTEALQIAQKAYIKWISNHYPGLKDVVVWFENSAIPGYLVAATNVYSGQQEYYIFSQDLTEARLVTRDSTQLVPRLQMLPALHLAAPEGCIRAQTESTTAHTTEAVLNGIHAPQSEIDLSGSIQDHVHPKHEAQPNGLCGAHEMEMD